MLLRVNYRKLSVKFYCQKQMFFSYRIRLKSLELLEFLFLIMRYSLTHQSEFLFGLGYFCVRYISNSVVNGNIPFNSVSFIHTLY